MKPEDILRQSRETVTRYLQAKRSDIAANIIRCCTPTALHPRLLNEFCSQLEPCRQKYELIISVCQENRKAVKKKHIIEAQPIAHEIPDRLQYVPPGETITIYHEPSDNIQEEESWTTERQAAIWRAREDPNREIWEAAIRREDIIAYFCLNDEMAAPEVLQYRTLIDPHRITIDRQEWESGVRIQQLFIESLNSPLRFPTDKDY